MDICCPRILNQCEIYNKKIRDDDEILEPETEEYDAEIIPEEVEISSESPKIEYENDKIPVEETQKEFTSKGRNFIFTLHQKIESKLERIKEKLQEYSGYRYMLITQHLGERKDGKPIRPHIHSYVQYSTVTTLSSKSLYNVHLEKCYGSAQANIKYLMAQDGKPRHEKCVAIIKYQDGVPAYKGGAVRPNDIIQAYEEGKNPELEMSYQFYNVARKVIEDHQRFTANQKWIKQKLRQKDNPIIVNYHVGAPGAGKTTAVAEQYDKMNPDEYAIMEFDDNGFSHILEPRNPEKVKYMFINEFRDTNIKFKYFLEILQNEHIFNIKGSDRYYPNLHQIDITTVQHPHQIYTNACEDRNQIKRRITNTYFWLNHDTVQKVETIVDIKPQPLYTINM